MVHKINFSSILLIKFVYQSLTNKQTLNYLKSSSYKTVFYLRLKIMKMLLISENFEDSQASDLRSSIHCIYICLDALFPMRIISNEMQPQARI